jgi:uronate dehydrogenase
MPKVLVTGGAGRIGSYLAAGLPELGWEVRPFDLAQVGKETTTVGDVRDRSQLVAAARNVDAVVHLAAALGLDNPFAEILDVNIRGTYNVFDAACEAGVKRVVFASSNHANGYAPRSSGGTVGWDRPDSYYGVSKLFGESLGRFYVDRYGMEVACIRIGSCFDTPTNPRMLGSWLSPGDCVRLVDACLRYPELTYEVVYGVSKNSRRWWDVGPAERLGYRSEDDAERFAADVLRPLDGVDPGTADEAQGGPSVCRDGS